MDIINKLKSTGIIPVIKIKDASRATDVAKALLAGGISSAEITFRTEAAEQAIKNIAKGCPEIFLGAGTVLNITQARKAVDAGARFIVSPGFNPEVVQYCIDKNIPIIPGVNSPSDIEHAMGFDLKVLKFFPAEISGGLKAIKTLSAVYSNIFFVPTGGINQANVAAYLSHNSVLACGGSWMVKSELIETGSFETITNMANEAVKAALDFKVAHIGINQANDTEAQETAGLLASLFGFQVKAGNSSIFASDSLEIMKSNYLGEKGHIGIGTSCIDLAQSVLENRGYSFNKESIKVKDGSLKAIYLKNEIAGFAIHLVQR